MMSLAPSWDLCVLSYEIDDSQTQALANAFLYGDRVLFLPIKGPLLLANVLTAGTLAESESFHEKMSPLVKKGFSTDGLIDAITQRQNELNKIIDFLGLIDRTGLPRLAVDSLGDKEVKLYRHFAMKHILTEAMLSGASLRNAKFNWATVLRKVENEYLASEEVTQAISENKILMEAIGRCYGCYIDPRCPRGYCVQASPQWSTHRAADFLTRAAHKVLLPDISDIPLEEVVTLRDRLKDELSPMRAEMLRLSNSLREVVEDSTKNDVNLMLEAENLIATNVEPIVHEVAKHAKDELNNRLKKYLQKTVRTIALAGVGYLFPSFLKDAIKEGVDALGSIAFQNSSSGNLKTGTATARFMIELRRTRLNT